MEDELEEVARFREAWVSLLRLLPPPRNFRSYGGRKKIVVNQNRAEDLMYSLSFDLQQMQINI